MVAGFLCAAGVLMSGAAFALGGFRLNAFSVGETAEEKTYDASSAAEGLERVVLDVRDQPVEVAISADNRVHIRYWEDEHDTYTITEEGGSLSLVHTNKPEYFSWLTEGFFSNFADIGRKVVLELPAAYAGALQIKTTNGSVRIEGFRALAECSLKTTNGSIRAADLGVAAFTAETTNASLTVSGLDADSARMRSTNGSLLAENVRLSGSLDADTSNASLTVRDTACGELDANTTNGGLRLEAVTTTGRAQAGTTNSGIKLEALSSPDIRLSSTNGSIRGTVVGDIRDYAISSHTTNGDNNLPDTAAYDLPNKLSASTTNSSIDIRFVA